MFQLNTVKIRVRHRREMSPSPAGRPLAIRAEAVCDEGRLGIEPVRHLTAGTMTSILLAHIIFLMEVPSRRTVSRRARWHYGRWLGSFQ